MTETIEIQPSGPVCGTIRPPGSKSITNRALVCAALAQGESTLRGALASEDTRVMVDALRALGLAVEHDPAASSIRVSGCGGRLPGREADLFIGNSGTTARFLTAVLTLGHGTFRLDGTRRMRERPIQDLLDALGQLGADAASETGSGAPPVVVRGAGLPGGRATVAGDISSQFLSALLMAAPCAESPVELAVSGELVSKPYVEMTLAVMRAFGAQVEKRDGEKGRQGDRETDNHGNSPPLPISPSPYLAFLVPSGQHYQGRVYEIEPDASAASYFFAAAAVTGGEVTVEGLSRDSLQGDVAFCECLARMGCEVRYGADVITVSARSSSASPSPKVLRGIDVDMNAISDTVQTLAAVAISAEGPTTITGVAHIRHKETDRLSAVATELRKLGAEVEERGDGLRIVPGAKPRAHSASQKVFIDTYDDHRMAMSFAVAGLARPGVVIRDPQCTTKTYPDFFSDLARLTMS